MKRRRYGGQGGKQEKSRDFSKSQESLNLSFEGLKNFDSLLEKVSAYFKSSLGIGMNADNVVSMDWFADAGYYTQEEVEQDKERVANLEEKFVRNDTTKNPNHEKMKDIADTFEKSVSVIFHYALKAKGLSVIPTARHTDIFDGVDSFVLHEKTGQIICAIDETNSSRNNIIHGSKLNNIIRRNEEGRVIKYGIALNQEDRKWYPTELKREDAPLAYLSVPREQIVKFIEDLSTIDVNYDEDVEVLCDDLFTKLIHSLYQSLYHIMTNMPEQHEKMNDLINLLQKETGLDPNLSDLV